MTLKPKSFLWYLTFPFAHDNCTTVGHTLYYKGAFPPGWLIAHEECHERQWMKVGFFKFYFLYLFCLPILWNPWRRKWELEAGTPEKVLKTYKYGWV